MIVTSCVAALVCLAMSTLLIVGVHMRASDARTDQTFGAALRVADLVERGRLPRLLAGQGTQTVQVLNASGQVVSSTKDLAGKPPIATLRSGGDVVRAQGTLCPPRGLT